MIRKKLIYTVFTVLATNVKTYETKEMKLKILGKFSERKAKKVMKDFSDETVKILQLISFDEIEVIREMSIDDFIKHSEIVED